MTDKSWKSSGTQDHGNQVKSRFQFFLKAVSAVEAM